MSEAAVRKGALVRRITRSVDIRGVPRLLYATRKWVLSQQSGIFDVGGGNQMVLDVSDYFQCMMYYGRFCPEILEALQQFVRPGDTVLDVGAQVGYFSLHVARLVTASGMVYSFEPDSRSFSRLTTATQLSGVAWVKAIPIALSAHEGAIDFYLSPTLGWSTAVKNSHLQDLQQVSVPTVPLDVLVSRGTVPSDIRLLKIDVEGYELEVLRGMPTVLAKSRPILLVEVNNEMLHAQGTSSREILEYLQSFSYRISRIEKNLRWWRSRPRMSLYPAENGFLENCDLVCLPEEFATSGVRGGEIGANVITRD